MLRLCLLLCFYVVGSGCSTGADGLQSDQKQDAQSFADGDAADESNGSAAACGKQVGDSLCEVSLLGYDHPTGFPPVFPGFSLELKLSAMVAAAPRRHVLVLVGGAWCPLCKMATAAAVKQYDEIKDHITLINVLIEGDKPTMPARKSHVDLWLKRYKTPFTVVADGFNTPLAARKALGLREASLLVDRATGRIVARADTLAKLWPKLKLFK